MLLHRHLRDHRPYSRDLRPCWEPLIDADERQMDSATADAVDHGEQSAEKSIDGRFHRQTELLFGWDRHEGWRRRGHETSSPTIGRFPTVSARLGS